jgi:hypothetical protein
MKSCVQSSFLRLAIRGTRGLSRSPFLLGLGLVCAAFAPARAASPPQTSTQNLTFQTSNQSMWGSGPQYELKYERFWGVEWDGSFSAGVSIPQVAGVEAKVRSNGKFGLRPQLTVKGGAVSATYPLRVTVELPANGQLRPGDPFTVKTSFAANPGGSLATSSPHARATLDLEVNASASATGSAWAALLGSTGGSIFDFTLDPVDKQIFDTDSQEARGVTNFLLDQVLGTATGGIVSGSFGDLTITTSGGQIPGSKSLRSFGEATFFNAQVSFSNALTGVASQGYTLDLGKLGSLEATLEILNAYENFDFKLLQDFQFDPSPTVYLVTSDGQSANVPVGGSAEFTFPVNGGTMTITPGYTMGGNLTNSTRLVISPSLNFTPFKAVFDARVGGETLAEFSVQPVDTITWAQGDQTFPLYFEKFGLQGFNPQAGVPVTLGGYTYARPTVDRVIPAIWKPWEYQAALSFANTKRPFVWGSGFDQPHSNAKVSIPGSKVQWNGQDRPTYNTYSRLDALQTDRLEFELTEAQATTEGIFNVTVGNPPPGGGMSDPAKAYIDGTPPVSTASLAGPQNANNNGWYKGPVTVSLSSTDTISGIFHFTYLVDEGDPQGVGSFIGKLGPGTVTAPDFQVSGDGNHTVRYSGYDQARNDEPWKVTALKIDGTPPTIELSRTPPNQYGYGWNNGPVMVHFFCKDATSGIASCPSDLVLDKEGANQNAAGTATDNAGNSASAAVGEIHIDLTKPTIEGSRTPAANAYGWNNGPVTVHFDCKDTLSGIHSCPQDTVLDQEGASQSVSGTVIDKANNHASATVDGIHIDLTKPTIAYSGNTGRYTVDQVVDITCKADDNLSGLLSDTAKNVAGPAYSFVLGTHSYSAEATDKAGNVGQGSTSFIVEVTYGSLCALVQQLVPHDGIVTSLCAKLRAAESAAGRGQQETKANILQAFVQEVQAQNGQHISADAAPILIQMARAL